MSATTTARLIVPRADLVPTHTPIAAGPLDTPKAAALAIALRSTLPANCHHVLVLDQHRHLIGYAPIDPRAASPVRNWLAPVLALQHSPVRHVIVAWQYAGPFALYSHAHQDSAELLRAAFDRCGITLLDYLIVADAQYLSLQEGGRL